MRNVPPDATAQTILVFFLGKVGIFSSGNICVYLFIPPLGSSQDPERGDCGSCTFNTPELLEEDTFLSVSMHLFVFIPKSHSAGLFSDNQNCSF